MNRKVFAIASLLAPVAVFAEGTSGYETVITDAQTSLTGALSSLAAPAAAIVVAGIGIWLIPKVVRVLKKAFNSAA